MGSFQALRVVLVSITANDHRPVEQRAVAVLRRLDLLQKVRQLRRAEPIIETPVFPAVCLHSDRAGSRVPGSRR